MGPTADGRSRFQAACGGRWLRSLIGLSLVAACALLLARATHPVDADSTAAYRHIATWRLAPSPGNDVAPLDVAAAADGTTYVADASRNLVVVFGPDGTEVDVWWPNFVFGLCDGYYVPQALDVDPVAGRVYVLWVFYDISSADEMISRSTQVEVRTLDGTTIGGFLANPRAATSPSISPPATCSCPTTWAWPSTTPMAMRLGTASFLSVPTVLAGAPSPCCRTAGWPAVKRTGLVEINTREGKRVRYLDLGHNYAVAVASSGDGMLHILVRPEQTGPDAAMVLTVDGQSGKVVGSLTARDLGLPPVPATDWPFSVAVAGNHTVASSAAERFEIGQPARVPILGARAETPSTTWMRGAGYPANAPPSPSPHRETPW